MNNTAPIVLAIIVGLLVGLLGFFITSANKERDFRTKCGAKGGYSVFAYDKEQTRVIVCSKLETIEVEK